MWSLPIAGTAGESAVSLANQLLPLKITRFVCWQWFHWKWKRRLIMLKVGVKMLSNWKWNINSIESGKSSLAIYTKSECIIFTFAAIKRAREGADPECWRFRHDSAGEWVTGCFKVCLLLLLFFYGFLLFLLLLLSWFSGWMGHLLFWGMIYALIVIVIDIVVIVIILVVVFVILMIQRMNVWHLVLNFHFVI